MLVYAKHAIITAIVHLFYIATDSCPTAISLWSSSFSNTLLKECKIPLVYILYAM